MAFDFPNSPSVGQLYPQPPVVGQPVYKWDGEKWTTIGGALGGKVAVYTDGTTPMTAQLTLVDPPVGGVSATSKNYVDAGDAAAAANVLRSTAQSLTAAQQQQSRQNIYAAPFDAMMSNNLINNGSFEVNQLAIASAVSGAGLVYFCDGWMLHSNVVTLACTATQVITNTAFMPGFPIFGNITVQTGLATLTTSEGCGMYIRIEGWRLARLAWGTANAQPVTLGFWSAHHRPGLYCVSLRGVGASVSYIATYTHAAADVPQYNSITIPGATIGVWPIDNLAELSITFGLAYGPSLQTSTANAWLSGNFTWLPSAVNGCAATTDVFRLAGATMFAGNEGPSAARSPLIMRPFDQELILCKRQLQRIGGDVAHDAQIFNAYCAANTASNVTFWYSEMRAPPVVSLVGAWTYTNLNASPTQFYPGKTSCTVAGQAPAAGQSFIDNPLGAYIKLDARL